MKNLIHKYRHAWILCYAFIYLPWFLYLEKTVTRDYHIMHIGLDDFIPFNEYFILPYVMWFLFISITILYFFFTNVRDYYKLCAMLFTGMTISLVICTVYPNGTDFRPMIDPGKNICSALVSWLYSTDTCTNVFPSIHVYNSICAQIAISHSVKLRKFKWIQCLSMILTVSICLATVFLKQHSVFDGIGSILMAFVLYQFIYAEGYAPSRRKVTQKAIG